MAGGVARACSSAAAFRAGAELIERLEGFQRDLEQQLADVADVLTHLRDRADDAPQLSSNCRPSGAGAPASAPAAGPGDQWYLTRP